VSEPILEWFEEGDFVETLITKGLGQIISEMSNGFGGVVMYLNSEKLTEDAKKIAKLVGDYNTEVRGSGHDRDS